MATTRKDDNTMAQTLTLTNKEIQHLIDAAWFHNNEFETLGDFVDEFPKNKDPCEELEAIHDVLWKIIRCIEDKCQENVIGIINNKMRPIFTSQPSEKIEIRDATHVKKILDRLTKAIQDDTNVLTKECRDVFSGLGKTTRSLRTKKVKIREEPEPVQISFAKEGKYQEIGTDNEILDKFTHIFEEADKEVRKDPFKHRISRFYPTGFLRNRFFLNVQNKGTDAAVDDLKIWIKKYMDNKPYNDAMGNFTAQVLRLRSFSKT